MRCSMNMIRNTILACIDMEYQLNDEYIELMKLLKYLNVVQSGGEAKMVISEGLVKVNGQVEFRKRHKLRKGFVIEFEDIRIDIV